MQGYYTLEEASQFLAMTVDELRQMAQKNLIRSFQDRGTLRFRVQDIQELGRQRGVASDLDLPLGELPKPKKGNSQAGMGSKVVKDDSDEDFSLEVADDMVDIGRESGGGPGRSGKQVSSSSRRASPRPVPGSDSDVRLIADGDLALDAHSDSDIRLVSPENKPSSGNRRRSSLAPTPPVAPKQSGKLVSKLSGKLSGKLLPDTGSGPRKSKLAGPGSPLPQRKSSLHPTPPTPAASDSGVRLVPLDSDSDVKIVGRSDEMQITGGSPPRVADSDIRLEKFAPKPRQPNEEMLLTEEINLDEEIRRQEEAMKQQPPQAKLKPKSRGPSVSPFELSDHDIAAPRTPPRGEKQQMDSSDFDLLPPEPSADTSDFDLLPPEEPNPDSSDFELTPAGDGTLALEGSAADFSLELTDDSDQTIALEEPGAALKGSSSGISLEDPVDAGLSLEQPDDGSVEFEINLDAEGGATPKPEPLADDSAIESSSEFQINLEDSANDVASPNESDFELGVDESSGEAAPLQPDSDSEFELTLDANDSSSELEASGSGEPTSDSEFELTLDDSGNLASEDETPSESVEGEQDIFETDFEVPGADDESGSQVAALDSDLESSDFDIEVEDESGSQVVAIDEDDQADDAAATVAAKSAKKGGKKNKTKVVTGDDDAPAEGLAEFGGLDDGSAATEPSDEEEEPVAMRAGGGGFAAVKVLRPAPWGALPVVFMLPCVIVMVMVGLLGFELIQNVNGYKPAGLLTRALADMMSLKIK